MAPNSTTIRLRRFGARAAGLIAIGFAACALPGAAHADGIIAMTGSSAPAVLSGVPCGGTSGGTTTTWQAATDDSWFTAANWDTGVPGGSTDLAIVPTGTGAAQLGTAAVVGGDLDICGGTVDVGSGGTLDAGNWVDIADGGTLLLSGSTSVSSPIVIDGGTLRAGTTGTLTSDLYLGDSADVNIGEADGETLTLTGAFNTYVNSDYKVIFGSPTDTGTILFSPTSMAFGSGANVAVEVAGGTLKADDGKLGSLFASSMTVDDGATLDFADQEPADTNIILDLLGAGNVKTGTLAATTITLGGADFSGNISGAGNLKVASICYAGPTVCTDGVATLSGTNDFTGSTTVSNDGSLTVSGAITATSAVTVDTDGAMTVDGSVTSSGAVLVQNGGMLSVGDGGMLTTTDAITVDAGVLTVDGTASATNGVTVNTDGTLAGTGTVSTPGTVSATQIMAGGAVAPGDSGIGTLNFAGDLTIAPGADYNLDVSSTTADKIVVDGQAGVAGNLNITVSTQPAAGTTFTILSASDGVTGLLHLTGAATPLGMVGPFLLYDDTNIVLDYEVATLSPHLPATATQNAIAVTGGIDNAIDPGTALPDAFQDLAALSANDLADATGQFSGEAAADLSQSEAAAVDPFLKLLVDESGSRAKDLSGMHRYRRHHRSIDFWLSGYGERNRVTGDTSGTGSHSLTGSAVGIAAGLDFDVTRGLLAGAALGYGHSSFSLSDNRGSSSSNNLQFGLHATGALGRYAYLAAGGLYALQDVKTHRAITIPLADVFDASFTAHDLGARIESGFHMRLSRVSRFTPFLAWQWNSFDAPRYSETGTSDYALTYDANSVSDSRVELGASLDSDVRLTYNTRLYLYGRAAYAHGFGSSHEAQAAFTALPGSGFTVEGAAPGTNLALLSFDAEFKGRNGFSLGIAGNGTLAQGSQTYYATANLGFAW